MKLRSAFVVVCSALLVITARASTTHYVNANAANPVSPYTDWSTASTNIQAAVDAATNGDLILVTNGVYATGGRSWFGSGTNRVILTNAVTLQSVNGPGVTLIVGNHVAGTGSALTNAARCVELGNNAVLSGFTLTNGEAGTGNYPNGGGVEGSVGGTITNCVLVGNLSTNGVGGGAYRVALINCQIIGNYASYGGGACACTLNGCTVVSNTASEGGGVYGGGVYGASLLTNCTIAGNSATSSGGGAYGGTLNACTVSNNTSYNGGGTAFSTLNNCVLTGNSASTTGGGEFTSTLNNCLLTGNSASLGGGAGGGTLNNCTIISNSASSAGGGVDSSSMYVNNSIVYYNTAPSQPNWYLANLSSCCTTPLPGGSGNITNEPGFLALLNGDFHLKSNSPCINSGNNAYATNLTDLDGNRRIVAGTVDIGAYEYQTPASIISFAWLQQYGLATDGSADGMDTDGDGMNNWQEWISGTNPTNAASALRMVSARATNNAQGIVVTWQSVSGISYFLQSAGNLANPPLFSTIQTKITGQPGTTSYTDTSATNGAPHFYRVGVQ